MEDIKITGADLRMKTEESRRKLWIDDGARSLSYFCRQNSVVIGRSVVSGLKKIAEEKGRVNARICLHSSPQDFLHDMIILEYRDKKCRKPHKHLERQETLQMIEGSMLAFTFSDSGEVEGRFFLSPDGSFMFRTPVNQYHLYLPTTDFAVYKETKLGPFKPEDNIPPNWDYAKALREQCSYLDLDCSNPGCKSQCSLGVNRKGI